MWGEKETETRQASGELSLESSLNQPAKCKWTTKHPKSRSCAATHTEVSRKEKQLARKWEVPEERNLTSWPAMLLDAALGPTLLHQCSEKVSGCVQVRKLFKVSSVSEPLELSLTSLSASRSLQSDPDNLQNETVALCVRLSDQKDIKISSKNWTLSKLPSLCYKVCKSCVPATELRLWGPVVSSLPLGPRTGALSPSAPECSCLASFSLASLASLAALASCLICFASCLICFASSFRPSFSFKAMELSYYWMILRRTTQKSVWTCTCRLCLDSIPPPNQSPDRPGLLSSHPKKDRRRKKRIPFVLRSIYMLFFSGAGVRKTKVGPA